MDEETREWISGSSWPSGHGSTIAVASLDLEWFFSTVKSLPEVLAVSGELIYSSREPFLRAPSWLHSLSTFRVSSTKPTAENKISSVKILQQGKLLTFGWQWQPDVLPVELRPRERLSDFVTRRGDTGLPPSLATAANGQFVIAPVMADTAALARDTSQWLVPGNRSGVATIMTLTKPSHESRGGADSAVGGSIY